MSNFGEVFPHFKQSQTFMNFYLSNLAYQGVRSKLPVLLQVFIASDEVLSDLKELGLISQNDLLEIKQISSLPEFNKQRTEALLLILRANLALISFLSYLNNCENKEQFDYFLFRMNSILSRFAELLPLLQDTYTYE